MHYSLYRTRDNAGDSGNMSMLLRRNSETNDLEEKHNARPEVGWVVRVGSVYARSFAPQDWWQTTYVTEILEHDCFTENGHEVEMIRFKTGNSEYVWKSM